MWVTGQRRTRRISDRKTVIGRMNIHKRADRQTDRQTDKLGVTVN